MINKTSIVSTLGPASDSLEMIQQLLDAGVSIFRFNFYFLILIISFCNFTECYATEIESDLVADGVLTKEVSERENCIREIGSLKNKDGETCTWHSTGTVLNVLGNHNLKPLNIRKLVEFDLTGDNKAFVVLNESRDYSWLIIYKDFNQKSKNFSLHEKSKNISGWLLNHSSIENEEILNYVWRGFLTNPKVSSFAYSLTGDVTISKNGSNIINVMFNELSTAQPVAPDIRVLMQQGSSYERDIAEAKKQLLVEPESGTLKTKISDAQSALYRINELLKEGNMKPAYINGAIEAHLGSRKPKYDIGPLL